MPAIGDGRLALLVLFVVTQALYLASMLVTVYFYTRPVDLVDPVALPAERAAYPPVLLLYPVLRELEETMRTTFCALDKLDYPRDRYRIVAIPNHDDHATIAALVRLQAEFSWLELHVRRVLGRRMEPVGEQPEGLLVACRQTSPGA